MIERLKINERLTVDKAHPGEQDLRELAREGFKAVVNLRTEGEENQPLSPDEEGRVVRGLGMDSLHYPVTSGDLSAELVDGFRRRLGDLPRPLFAHCASGDDRALRDLLAGRAAERLQALRQRHRTG